MKASLVKSTMVLDDGGSLRTRRGIVMESRFRVVVPRHGTFRSQELFPHFYPALTHRAHFIPPLGGAIGRNPNH
jgi:hypothetical protein